MIKKILSSALLIGWCQTTHAADPFNATAFVGCCNTGTAGFTTAEEAFDSLQTRDLNSIVPYEGFEIVRVNIDFRGLALVTDYPIEGSSRLELSIPSLGISETFIGETRDDSLEMLKDYFKDGDHLNRIMKELASKSPVDPIAGNPNSLQSRMVSSIYDRSFRSLVRRRSEQSFGGEQAAKETPPLLLAAIGDDLPTIGNSDSNAAKVPAASAGLQVSRYRQSGLTTVGVTMPLSYSFGAEPERPLSLAGDLHYTDTEAAETYSLTLGAAYSFSANERWYLIPAVNYGVTASEDLGSMGQMASVSLTSAAMIYENNRTKLWMGNAINYLRSLKASIEDYSFDPKLRNVAFVNGLVLATSPSSLEQNFWLEYSIADTRYTGSDLYDERYDEIGVSIVWSKSSDSYFRAGLSYLNTTHSEGWLLNFHSSF